MLQRHDELILIQNMFLGPMLPETQKKIMKKKFPNRGIFSMDSSIVDTEQTICLIFIMYLNDYFKFVYFFSIQQCLLSHVAFFITAASQLRAVTILWHNYA